MHHGRLASLLLPGHLPLVASNQNILDWADFGLNYDILACLYATVALEKHAAALGPAPGRQGSSFQENSDLPMQSHDLQFEKHLSWNWTREWLRVLTPTSALQQKAHGTSAKQRHGIQVYAHFFPLKDFLP